jgi:hypothetical protein
MIAGMLSNSALSMDSVQPGDLVRWTRAVAPPERLNSVGSVREVFAEDSGFAQFRLYEIHFPFGLFTLYGTQLERVQPK